jgi:dipeptidyl aminopeptidase/acylaminoacyl peptidase
MDVQPRWSPDGKNIVYMSDRDDSDDVWLMDTDGKNVSRNSVPFGTQYSLYMYHKDGGSRIRVTGNYAQPRFTARTQSATARTCVDRSRQARRPRGARRESVREHSQHELGSLRDEEWATVRRSHVRRGVAAPETGREAVVDARGCVRFAVG